MITIRPFPQTRALDWFHQHERINPSPPYQRQGGLWSARDRAYLIDSLLNGFDVPKFYLADFTARPSALESDGYAYAIIDGRQRFEAIVEWFGGELRLADEFVYEREPQLALAGMNYRELRRTFPEIARVSEEFALSVMSVITDEPGKVEQLFIRLNTSKALVGAERRNAMEGIVPDMIREVASHEFFLSRIRFGVSRGADRNAAAKLLLIEYQDRLVDIKRGRLDQFVEHPEVIGSQAGLRLLDESFTAEATDASLHQTRDRVLHQLDRQLQVFRERDELLRRQGPIPVYYWLIRALDDSELREVRDFLARFEAARQANSALLEQQGQQGPVDQVLLRYDMFERSTNDQKSLQGRFEILLDAFRGRIEMPLLAMSHAPPFTS
jgi:hypothetical protein